MIPPRLQGSDPLVAWLNKLRDEVAASKLNSVVGGTFTRGPGGTNIVVKPTKALRVVYVKCCLADSSEAYLPVLVAGEAFTTNAGATTPLTVAAGDVPDGAIILE